MDFKSAYNLAARRIEERYGIDVRIADVVDPNTGDFDGTEILIDYDQDLEIALFVLLHLFGHTVQWNISEEYRRIGLATGTGKSDEEMAAIREYERDATRYSVTLLHDVGVTDLDQWISDWCHADWTFLEHFYRTGERLDVRTIYAPGCGEMLTPKPIPEFTPQRFVSRFSF